MQHKSAPDLRGIARKAMRDNGLDPDFPADAASELRDAEAREDKLVAPDAAIRDMRCLLWSSIDNRESRDLDQIEYAERLADGGFRLLVGIADVDAFVPLASAIDRHAAENTVSVYTPAIIFPMLPERLSTDITSLLEGVDRLAVIMELTVMDGGDIGSKDVYRAVVNNRAKMDYESVGAWLEGGAPPPQLARVEGLEAQVRLQDEVARSLYELRRKNGALELERDEAVPVVEGNKVLSMDVRRHNPAQDIIESLMIAANTAMAELLEERGMPSLRRVVRAPERWPRIVETANSFGEHLPDAPDPRALADLMRRRRAADPKRYAELSLAILKMLGPGDYMVEAPGLEQEGHFSLAVHD